LICDDGSNVQSRTLLDEYSRADRRIKLVRGVEKTDLASKLNACIKQAQGEFIARMDDDDYSHSDRLEKQLAFLKSKPDVAFVGSNVEQVRGNERVEKRLLPEKPTVNDFLFTQPYVHPALVFRREALLAIGGYSESPAQLLCEDYDLLLRLYEQGFEGANIQECLLEYSLPETVKGSRKMSHRRNEVKTRYYHFKKLGLLPRAWPYVIKPIAVGLLPEFVLRALKR